MNIISRSKGITVSDLDLGLHHYKTLLEANAGRGKDMTLPLVTYKLFTRQNWHLQSLG